MPEHLIIEKHDHFVGSITMNRPESLNTFTTPMAGELAIALLDMDDDPEVRVVDRQVARHLLPVLAVPRIAGRRRVPRTQPVLVAGKGRRSSRRRMRRRGPK